MSVEISVIIPVYNVAEYLPTCIESVLSQNFKNIELIVINDQSPDNAQKIIDMYAKQDSRVVSIIHEKNSGVGIARNTGIANARGKYIYFIDSDDFLHPKALQLMYDKMCEYHVKGISIDIVAGGFLPVEDTYYDIEAIQNIAEKKISPRDAFKKEKLLDDSLDIMHCFSAKPYVCNRLYRADLLKNTDIEFRAGLAEDIEYVNKLLLHIKNTLCIKESLYYYRQRVDSRSSVKNVSITHVIRTITDLINIISRLREYYVAQGVLQLYNHLLEQMVYNTVYTGVFNTNIALQNRHVTLALFLQYCATESIHPHSVFNVQRFFDYNACLFAHSNLDTDTILRWLFFALVPTYKKTILFTTMDYSLYTQKANAQRLAVYVFLVAPYIVCS